MSYFKWFALASMVVLSACKHTQLVSSWKNSERPLHYQKILVIGLVRDDSSRLQKEMENQLAASLRNLGYNTVTSTAAYGPNEFYNLTEKEALAQLQKTEVDAVITIVLVNKKIEKIFVPDNQPTYGNINYAGDNKLYTPYGWINYPVIKNQFSGTGYFTDNTGYTWETNFYHLPDQLLVYRARTISLNPSGEENIGYEHGRLIVKNMQRNNILEKQEATEKKGF